MGYLYNYLTQGVYESQVIFPKTFSPTPNQKPTEGTRRCEYGMGDKPQYSFPDPRCFHPETCEPTRGCQQPRDAHKSPTHHV